MDFNAQAYVVLQHNSEAEFCIYYNSLPASRPLPRVSLPAVTMTDITRAATQAVTSHEPVARQTSPTGQSASAPGSLLVSPPATTRRSLLAAPALASHSACRQAAAATSPGMSGTTSALRASAEVRPRSVTVFKHGGDDINWEWSSPSTPPPCHRASALASPRDPGKSSHKRKAALPQESIEDGSHRDVNGRGSHRPRRRSKRLRDR